MDTSLAPPPLEKFLRAPLALWKVVLAEISVLLFTSWKTTKSYTVGSIKLSRNNLFRLYFVEKDIIREGNGRKLREVIGS